ncbi:MAG: hypothetical protein IJY90_02295 [Clostridia bacterium]|nr:hypothetical protein [Clostridia bacterium]
MKYFGIKEEDMGLLVYGVPQYLINYVKELQKTYPEVKIHIPVYEKALKIQKQTYGKNYTVRYYVENLPQGFAFEDEYYKYLKANYKDVI